MSEQKENKVDLNSFYAGKKKTSGSYKKKSRRSGKKRKNWFMRMKKWQKTVFISAVALVLIVAIIAGYGLNLLGKIKRDDDFNSNNSEELGIVDVIDSNIFNLALFGVDSREVGNFDGLSDSIMILSINKAENTIRLVSVMRDSLVPIERKNGKVAYDKINSAYSTGGPTLAVKTLNTLFGLDISEYATVNFYGMSDIIDGVGGIEADLTEDEVRYSNNFGLNDMIAEQCSYLKIEPDDYYIWETGPHHLNGLQAVAYARIRHGRNFNGSNDDFGRTERQRYVMRQLLDKALSMNPTAYPGLINKLVPYVKTSLSNAQMLSLGTFLMGKPSMLESRVPDDGYIINADFRGTGSSTVYYNYEYAGKVLRAFLYDHMTAEEYMTANGVDRTPWYGNSGSGSGSGGPKPSKSSTPATSSTPQPSTSSTKPESSKPESSKPESSKPESSAPESPETPTPPGTTSSSTGSETPPTPEKPDPATPGTTEEQNP